MRVLLQLQKQQFDKGMSQVKASIAGLGKTIKSVAGMIVGGLGLGALVNQFKDTSTQLSVVKATMENVSEGFKEYSENMAFIKRISKDYGQDMLSLTNGFAKFRAAAKQTNLSLDQQRDIYESLTRAAGAFHLSADQTSNVMMAVEQMMSKGKVTAEELRRQLGNALPGAFQMMAQAAGMANVTVNGTAAELEAAMKSGKVMAEDVLPHFAQVLNATTAAANFDSLQSSLNRFRNAWVDFVENSGFEGAFKGLVDAGTKALNKLSQDSKAFGRTVISGIGGALAWVGVNGFRKLQAEGEKNLDPLTNYIKSVQKELGNTKTAIGGVEKELARLNSTAGDTHQAIVGKDDIKYIQNLNKEDKKLLETVTRRGNLVVREMDKNEALVMLTKKRNDLEEQRVQLYGKLDKIDANTIAGAKNINLALEGAKSTLMAFGTALKGIAVNMAAAFAVTLIVNWISKIVQAVKEAERLKNMVKDTQAEAEKAAGAINDQIARMNALEKIVRDTNSSEELRQRALKEINRLLGNQKFAIDDIKGSADNVAIAILKWKTNLINAARASAYFSKIQELEAKKIDLETKRNEITSKPGYEEHASHAVMNGAGIKTPIGALTDEAKQVAKYTKEIDALDASIANLLDTMKHQGLNDPFSGPDNEDIDSAKAIRTALDGYKNSLAELDKKLKDGSISTKKYNRDVNKLREDTLKTIQKYDDWEDVVESLGSEYEKLVAQLKVSSSISSKKTPLQQLKEDLDEFSKEKSKLDNTLKSGKMSGEEYAKALESLVNKYKDNVFGMDDLAGKLNKLGQKYKDIVDEINEAIGDIQLWNELEEQIKENDKVLERELDKSLEKIQKYFEKSAEIMAGGVPNKKEKENGFFAYKDGLDKTLHGYAKDAQDYVKELENIKNKILELKKYGTLDPAMSRMLDEVIEKLRVAKNEASSLTDAANFAELSEDIKELKKQLGSDVWDVWAEGIVGATGRITSALQSMNDAFGGDLFDEDFLERVSAIVEVFDSLNTVVETITNTFSLFNSVIETNKKLQEAQAAMTALQSGTKRKALAAEIVAEKASQGATISAESAKQAAIGATTTALAGQAVAGAASSQSSIPIVGPILAAAAVTGIVALLAANMKKFSGGGLVGGNNTQGDNQMVRVNSQEMILNKHQQANLWSMLKNGGTGGGGVDFRIRGADLVGVLKNYDSRMRG